MPRGSVKAEAELTASSRKLDPALRRAEKKYDRFGKKVNARLKKSFGGLRNYLGAAAGLGGIMGLASTMRSVLDFNQKLTRLKIQASVQEKRSWKEMDRFRTMVYATSDATGAASDELLDAASRFVSLTGDMDGATASLETFAKVAVASGSTLEDIATTAAALQDNLEIDSGDIQQAFSIMLTSGKMGAVELKEFAGLMATLSAQFPVFGKTGVRGLADLSAAMQVARKGFGNASEAATGLMGLMRSFIANADKFENKGVKMFTIDETGTKKFRNMVDIFDDLGKSEIVKDPTLMKDIFGRAEGMQAYEMIRKKIGLMKGLIKLGLESNAVQEDYVEFSESAAGRMQRSWERMKNSIARVFTPERIDTFAKALENVAWVVDKLAKNLYTVGAIVAGIKLSGGLSALINWKGDPAASAGAGRAWGSAAGRAFAAGGVLYAGATLIAKAVEGAQEEELQARQESATARSMLTGKGRQGRTKGRTFMRTMREQGVIKESGEIDESRLEQVVHGLTPEQVSVRRRGREWARAAGGQEPISEGMKAAVTRALIGEMAKREKVEIEVKIKADEQMLVKTETKVKRDQRRSAE